MRISFVLHIALLAASCLAFESPAIAQARPAGGQGAAGGVVQVGSVRIALPPGWKEQRLPEAAILMPENQPQGGCMVIVTKELDDEFHDDMKAALFAANNMVPVPLRPFGRGGISRFDGVAGKGWHYIDLYGSVGDPRENMAAHVLVANLGSKKVFMIGIGSAAIETNVYALAPEPTPTCLAGQSNRMWVALFHSLRFPGYEADAPDLGRQIVGNWSRSGKYSFALTFQENGEYSDGAAHGLILDSLKPGKVEEHMTTVASSGRFEVQGDRLIRRCTRGCNGARDSMISVVRRSDPKSPGGVSWTLRMIDLPSPAGYFTFDYGKDR